MMRDDTAYLLKRAERIVDFAHVPESQIDIHERLQCWARWVSVRINGWQTHPMWRNCKSSRQWDIEPHISQTPDILDALAIERAVSSMPDKQRDALRWYYVKRSDAMGMCRFLGLSKQGLADCVFNGRTMLRNKLPK